MNQKISFRPPVLDFSILMEGSGYPIVPTRLQPPSLEVTGNQFIFATLTPTAAYSSFDPLNGTESGAGATVEKMVDAFGLTGQALFFSLTARPADTDALLDNTVIVSIGGVEVARIMIDADSQSTGQHYWIAPASAGAGDNRFALVITGTNVTGGAIESDDPEVYTKAAHGLITGQRIKLVSLTGGTGLVASTVYYFHKLTADTGRICASYANAIAGTAVPVTTDATNVVLTPNIDVGISLTRVDPNLVLDFRLIATDGGISS